ncbi:MAG: hypothetical protein WBC51_05630 [Vicinamibacterales bacterium]
MTVESWLAAAIADAESRGLAGLKPILETLARSTLALREADRRAKEDSEAKSGESPG